MSEQCCQWINIKHQQCSSAALSNKPYCRTHHVVDWLTPPEATSEYIIEKELNQQLDYIGAKQIF